VVITSHKSYGECDEIFADQVLASAILDRALHQSTTLNVWGQRYRLREKLPLLLRQTIIAILMWVRVPLYRQQISEDSDHAIVIDGVCRPPRSNPLQPRKSG